ncbi:MAG: conjugal transfer protein TraX, partial [Acetatifactor sp.]|nr:conjugal transfer protein TraX [Acetatifactor sp.]
FLCLYILNVKLLGGYYYSFQIFGHEIEFVQQGLAMIALIPIWLYQGRQGFHNKIFQYACYAFYPVHITILLFLQYWLFK